MGFSRQEYWSGLPFPSLVDNVLSELSTVTHPSWVALHSMAHIFTVHSFISSLTTSNLPWFRDLTFLFLLFFTILDFIFTARHIHIWTSFLLWPSYFILSGAISNCPLLFPSRMLDTLWLGGSSVVICFLPFHAVRGFSRQDYWRGISFPPPVDNILSKLFIWPICLVFEAWLKLHLVIQAPMQRHEQILHIICNLGTDYVKMRYPYTPIKMAEIQI